MVTAGTALRQLKVKEWSIGFADLDISRLLSEIEADQVLHVTPGVRWFRKPWRVRDQADPFLVQHGDRLFVYFEEILFGSWRGRLRCSEIAAGSPRVLRGILILAPRPHASYPYVFEHQGCFYCIPETSRAGEAALYRSETPLGPWTKEVTIIDGVGATDSTVVFFDDRWWLFCTILGPRPKAHRDLYIWHAPALTGPWQPHQLQPAKTDIHSARPAGRPIVVNGVLYRPAQDCLPRYGSRVVVNRVTALTPSVFAEKSCLWIEPDPKGPKPHALHTVSVAGNVTAVDGMTEHMSANPLKVIVDVFGRVVERIRFHSEVGPAE